MRFTRRSGYTASHLLEEQRPSVQGSDTSHLLRGGNARDEPTSATALPNEGGRSGKLDGQKRLALLLGQPGPP